MSQSVAIVGAGLAGLTLGRCLLKHGIQTVLYEKASKGPRHNYGITIHGSTSALLCTNLGINQTDLRKQVAVDADIGGTGRATLPAASSVHDTANALRANRSKLEDLLREGLDVRYGHALQDIVPTPSGPDLRFAGGAVLSAALVVGADGAHSFVRNALFPDARLDVLPYAAYNGKRRVSCETFKQVYEPAMMKETRCEERHGDVLLHVSLNRRGGDEVSISWTYSRPARGDADALHRPGRSNADAKSIREELFKEVEAMTGLRQPFLDVFSRDKMREDRILHWLMRRSLTPLQQLQDVLAQKRVCLIGDAAHAEPIIGGQGANAAIIDGIQFANVIAESGVVGLEKQYSTAYPLWERGYAEDEQRIGEVHGVTAREEANL